ncbi:hypothetical protein A2U01_0106472, partial [Trifolium medium]|nr:hypothetical protein [Trifolium medium]
RWLGVELVPSRGGVCWGVMLGLDGSGGLEAL